MSVVFNGNANFGLRGINTISGNDAGSTSFGFQRNDSFVVGAATPVIEGGGGYQGQFTAVSGGTLLNLADPSNIVKSGGTGTIFPAQGYTVSASKKLRALYLENTDAAKTVTITIPGSNGLAGLGWVASAVVLVLQPGAAVLLEFPNGSATLTTGSNDGLTATSSSGSAAVNIAAIFG